MRSGRIVLAGLVAGLVMNVIDGVTNGFVLAAQWATETAALDPNLMAKMTISSTVGWIAADFACGLLLVWLYAAIRPRFGPGPTTAFLAAGFLWLATHVMFASYSFMGIYSWSLILSSSLGRLVAVMASGYVGGYLYRE